MADSSRSSEIQYRELRVTDDVVAITHLLHEAYAPLAAAGMRYVASHQSPEITRQRMGKGDTFVALDGERVIGVITLAEAASTSGSPHYDRPDVANFGQFAVLPAYQGRGVGSELIQMVEKRARDNGIVELALDTSEHAHHLIAMYERRGYRFVEYVRWAQVNYRSRIFSKRIA